MQHVKAEVPVFNIKSTGVGQEKETQFNLDKYLGNTTISQLFLTTDKNTFPIKRKSICSRLTYFINVDSEEFLKIYNKL